MSARPTKERLAVIRARVDEGVHWYASVSCGRAAAEDAAALLVEVDALPRIETCGDCGWCVTRARLGGDDDVQGRCHHRDARVHGPGGTPAPKVLTQQPPPQFCPLRKRKG